MRKEYSKQALIEENLPYSPFELFKKWFDEACSTEQHEPNAMCLSTCGPDMKPSARFLLLKAYDDRGFVWYTNYESRKSE